MGQLHEGHFFGLENLIELPPAREGLSGVGEDGRPSQDGLLVDSTYGVRRRRQDPLRIAAAAAEAQLVVLHLELVDERLRASTG